MFNAECCKLHDRGSLKFFRGMLLNGHSGGFVFFSGGLPEKGAQFFLGYVTRPSKSFQSKIGRLNIK